MKKSFKNGKVTVIMNGNSEVFAHRMDAIDNIGALYRNSEPGEARTKLGNILDHLWNMDKVCDESPCETSIQESSVNDITLKDQGIDVTGYGVPKSV